MFSLSDKIFLWSAFVSLMLSVSLWSFFDSSYGIFVGLWVPSILALWAGVKLTFYGGQSHE